MSSLRAAATLVFLALLSPEGLALRSSPKKKAVHKAHHRHHKTHKSLSTAAPVAAAAQEQKTQATGEAQLGHIQKELVEAWKHKAHMAKLRQTLEAEQKLLSSQQSLVESDVDDASDSAVQQQAAATKNMIKDAKVLLVKSRQDALKQTRAALKEAYQIKKTSEQAIEANNLAIKEATKAKEEAEKKVENVAQVIHAATEEAKFFFSQEVPDMREEKASTKSSPTLVKKAKESGEQPVKEEEKKIVSVAEKEEPAKPQPKTAELNGQIQKMQDNLDEEGSIKEEKKTELNRQIQKMQDNLEEQGSIKEEKKTVGVAAKQGPANPQPKQVELKEQVQKKHDSAVHAKEDKQQSISSQTKVSSDKKGNANHSSKGKGMIWDEEERKWMPAKLHEEDIGTASMKE